MNTEFIKQMALDYACPEAWITDGENHFSPYRLLEGRRRYHEDEKEFLKIASIGGKLLFAGREDILQVCREKYEHTSGAWFMEPDSLKVLEDVTRPFGYRIGMAHPFYLPAENLPFIQGQNELSPLRDGCELKFFRGSEIEQFRNDDRFDEAYAFNEFAPDMLGVAAVENGKILGMAGASADGAYLWQIGINVLPEYRHQHIASWLVKTLKDAVINEGKVPFYGMSAGHVASQRTALSAGFLPAWYEISFEPISKPPKITSRRETAMQLFSEGYNCAQSVILAFEDLLPYDQKTLAALASSFGGGMGRLREVCGALSAAFMVIGLKEGYGGPETGEVKKQLYRKVQALGKQFEKEHEGTMICRELLHLTVKHDVPVPEQRTAAYYESRPCPRLVGDAAAMLEAFLEDEEGFIADHEIEV